MSGHSKWATIKHKKGAADAKRGKLFAKLIKQVEVAARTGGGDPDANPTLRTMFQKARDNSVPLDTIERAVKRGTGELEGVNYETVTYEGYAPGGIALLIECSTDNRNRTSGDVRSTLSKNGGSLAEPGAVSWQFERKGVILVPTSVDEDDVMLAALDAGAEDIVDEGEMWQGDDATVGSASRCVRRSTNRHRRRVGRPCVLPTSTVEVADVAQVEGLMKALADLSADDLDDVQNVYMLWTCPAGHGRSLRPDRHRLQPVRGVGRAGWPIDQLSSAASAGRVQVEQQQQLYGDVVGLWHAPGVAQVVVHGGRR